MYNVGTAQTAVGRVLARTVRIDVCLTVFHGVRQVCTAGARTVCAGPGGQGLTYGSGGWSDETRHTAASRPGGRLWRVLEDPIAVSIYRVVPTGTLNLRYI